MPARSTRRNGERTLSVAASENVPRMRKQPRQVVLDGRLVVLVAAELTAEPRDEAGRQLVADRHPRPAAGLIGRLDLEDLQPEAPLERRDQRRGQEAGRQRAGADRELLLLRRRQLVRRRVEDDQRQDVGRVERRGAREPQLRLVERPGRS